MKSRFLLLLLALTLTSCWNRHVTVILENTTKYNVDSIYFDGCDVDTSFSVPAGRQKEFMLHLKATEIIPVSGPTLNWVIHKYSDSLQTYENPRACGSGIPISQLYKNRYNFVRIELRGEIRDSCNIFKLIPE